MIFIPVLIKREHLLYSFLENVPLKFFLNFINNIILKDYPEILFDGIDWFRNIFLQKNNFYKLSILNFEKNIYFSFNKIKFIIH